MSEFTDWDECDSLTPPTPGEVHLWRLPLDLPVSGVGRWRRLLDAAERQRADRFHFDRDRHWFTVRRAALRALLAKYLATAPQLIRFTSGPFGKPALADESLLTFNSSHARGIAVIAVSAGAPLGVDIEYRGRAVDIARVVRRFFADDERRQIMALPEAAREAAFYCCWTRKEAYIKARGVGLSLPLDKFAVAVDPAATPRLVWVAPEIVDGEPWQLYDFSPGRGLFGSLCVAVDGLRLVARHWRLR